MMRPTSRDDFFTWLLAADKRAAHAALEKMVDELHSAKEDTVRRFLEHTGSEDFLWALVRLLGSKTPRVAGNAAYIIGTLAESDYGCHRIVSLAEGHYKEGRQILPDLVNLLTSDDGESVMNAAGTIGTLAETEQGREWLLREPWLHHVLDSATRLLDSSNVWTASNASLILARLTISEEGCNAVLDHVGAHGVLTQLVASLGADEAGKGMNCAFAIGRLCDVERGRTLLLSLPEAGRMLSQLATMLCSSDAGSYKNACFAVSCLAASPQGHERLLTSAVCDRVVTQLAQLLFAADPETGWFAAMTLRTFASRPSGCLKLRAAPKIIESLQEATKSVDIAGEEKRREAREALLLLKCLDKPSPPIVKACSARSVEVSWPAVETRCRFDVTYKLIEGVSNCIYNGADTKFLMEGLTPCSQYVFRLRTCTTGDDSPFSDGASITLDEDVPGEPSNVKVVAATTSQLKIGWDPPEEFCGIIKSYYVYLGGALHESTLELSSIISGLTANTAYDVAVCAATSKGKGPRVCLLASTVPQGAHAPSKPQLMAMGRSEIGVTWNPPEVPLGRINRYDVIMNGKVIYSGTDLYCTARQLQANTEYTFFVSVFTNEGRQDSKAARKKTPKDEYEQQRTPLYLPPPREETKLLPDASVAAAPPLPPKRKKQHRAADAAVPSPGEKPTSAKDRHRRAKSSARVRSTTPSNPPEAAKVQEMHKDHLPVTGTSSKPSSATGSRSNFSDTQAKQGEPWPDPASASLDKHVPTAAARFLETHRMLRQDAPSDVVKLSRSLTRLTVTSFNPDLPPPPAQPVLLQRGVTMFSSRFTPSIGRHGMHSPGLLRPASPNGPASGSVTDVSIIAKIGTQPGSQGRFVPMQFRTQPLNLPNSKRLVNTTCSILMRRAGSCLENDVGALLSCKGNNKQ